VLGEPDPPANVPTLVKDEICPFLYLRRNHEFVAQAEGPAQWTYRAPDGSKMALPYPALRGAFQIHNAACALAALHALRTRLPVRAASVREGLLTVHWPGRFQVLPGRPTVVLDAAHNPHAARVLADALGGMGFHPETIAVFGMLNDKDVDGVITALHERVTRWHLVSTHGARGRSAQSLAARLEALNVPTPQIACYENAGDAYVAAHKTATEADRIVVFGSFHLLGDVASALASFRRPPS
jgi:dihydrofolate synthase / folylpolyglutamate synthase